MTRTSNTSSSSPGSPRTEFIARELKDTYPEGVAQNPVNEALRVIGMARNQLAEITYALVNHL
jgi:hypothetical protein